MRRALLLMAGLVAACTEPPRSPRDGGKEVADCKVEPQADACDDASRDNVMFTWARSVCTLLLDCCAKTDRWTVAAQMLGTDGFALASLKEPTFLDDSLACRRAIAGSLLVRFGAEYQALDDHRRSFDREAARECLGWFQQGAEVCAPGLVLLDEAHQPQACDRMFVANVPADAGCVLKGDCLRAGDGGASTCQSNTLLRDDGGVRYALDGVCLPLPGVGEYCPLPSSECGPGNYCSAQQRCRVRPTLGEACVAAPCDETTYCDLTQLPATCALRKTNYEPCSSTHECRERLTCDGALKLCIEDGEVSPLDVEFTFCLGSSDHRVARELPFVPRDGGL